MGQKSSRILFKQKSKNYAISDLFSFSRRRRRRRLRHPLRWLFMRNEIWMRLRMETWSLPDPVSMVWMHWSMRGDSCRQQISVIEYEYSFFHQIRFFFFFLKHCKFLALSCRKRDYFVSHVKGVACNKAWPDSRRVVGHTCATSCKGCIKFPQNHYENGICHRGARDLTSWL